MGIYDRSININSFTETGSGPFDSGLNSVGSSEIARLYQSLRTSDEFKLLWADRVQKHFYNGGVLTREHITRRFDELRDELRPLMPNMDTEILTWAQNRQSIFFNQMQPFGLLSSVPAPTFSQFGGSIAAGDTVSISASSGSIYYTTDGTDPRTMFTGDVSPAATSYRDPFSLNGLVTVKARARNGSTWSALSEATFSAASLGVPLRITEIMYNPVGGPLFEFVEVVNASGGPIDVSGFQIDGIGFAFFEGSVIEAGERIVLASDTDPLAWSERYPGVTPFAYFGGSLSNGGERVAIIDLDGAIVTSVDYRDDRGWPTGADGDGPSIELLEVFGEPDDPSNWQASLTEGGTPGEMPGTIPVTSLQINEVMADNLTAVDNAGTFPDWIELHNSGPDAINLEGWSLSDDDDPSKFVLPVVSIPAGGYLTVWCDEVDTNAPGLHSGFGLDRQGETVALYDAEGNRVDVVAFGNQIPNRTLARVDGEWTLGDPTPSAANVAAALGDVGMLQINEWMADSAPGEEDWVELYNPSDLPVSTLEIYLSNGQSAHELGFPAFIDAGGFLQIFADETPGPDHVDFKLGALGGQIVLHAPSTEVIQSVNYPAQSEGVSQGRLPDGANTVVSFPGSGSPAATNYLVDYDGPVLNEVLARNATVDLGGVFPDYVELFNGGATAFDLGGMSLSVNDYDPGEWTFPAETLLDPGAYLIIHCDGSIDASVEPGSFNIGQPLDGESGAVYLFNAVGQLMDSVEFGPQIADQPIGLSNGQWRLLQSATPGEANASAATLGGNAMLLINEWMANPADGADWFEIFNASTLPVSLDSITVTDDPSIAGRGKFQFEPLGFVGAEGFVKIVADATPSDGRHHVNFGLNALGDSILIHSAASSTSDAIDTIAFGAQLRGVSEGRIPDGSAEIAAFPGSATPGASNSLSVGDSDMDGVPDDVELLWGLNPNDPTDVLVDDDGDGLSYLEEFLAGTDPEDRDSYLRVEISTASDGATISFTAQPGRSYSIIGTGSLESPDWMLVEQIEAGDTERVVEVDDTDAGGVRFYRLVTPMIEP